MQTDQARFTDSIIGKRRLRLWEIKPGYHCALLGNCATLKDLSTVVKRSHIDLPDDIADFDLHHFFVNMANIQSPALTYLQKMLDRRYAREIRILGKLGSEQELLAAWQRPDRMKRVCGYFWAVMSHPLTSASLAAQIHGEMHLLSHTVIQTQQQSWQQIADMKQQLAHMSEQLDALSNRQRLANRERDDALVQLKKSLTSAADYRDQLTMARQRLAVLESSDEIQHLYSRNAELLGENEFLRSEANNLRHDVARANQRVNMLEGKNQLLSENLAQLKNRQATTCQELSALQHHQSAPPCQFIVEGNQQVDLCGRCVLVVGGRTGQCEHYRAMVERCNGKFIHHDGGREDSRQRLGSILTQADAVLCPLDSISHDAIKRVKRFCEQHTKPLVFMPRSSLTAFTEVLKEVAA